MNRFALLSTFAVLGCVGDGGPNVGTTNVADRDDDASISMREPIESGASAWGSDAQTPPAAAGGESGAGGGFTLPISSNEPASGGSAAALASDSGSPMGGAGNSAAGSHPDDASAGTSTDAGPNGDPLVRVDNVPGWDAGVPDGVDGCELGSAFYRTQQCQLSFNCLDDMVVIACLGGDAGAYRCWCIVSGFSNATLVDGEPFAGREFEPCVEAAEACLTL